MKTHAPFLQTITSRTAFVVVVLSMLLGVVGCGSNTTRETPPEPEIVYDDIETLTNGMALLTLPTEAQWIEYQRGTSTIDIGPSDLTLLAVMRFDEEGLAQLREQLTEPRPSTSVEADFVRDWFPAEVKNAFTPNQLNGFLEVNVPVYNATPFYSGSYQNGYAIIIGHYVLISMYTM
jgi:hypothetical protein